MMHNTPLPRHSTATMHKHFTTFPGGASAPTAHACGRPWV